MLRARRKARAAALTSRGPEKQQRRVFLFSLFFKHKEPLQRENKGILQILENKTFLNWEWLTKQKRNLSKTGRALSHSRVGMAEDCKKGWLCMDPRVWVLCSLLGSLQNCGIFRIMIGMARTFRFRMTSVVFKEWKEGLGVEATAQSRSCRWPDGTLSFMHPLIYPIRVHRLLLWAWGTELSQHKILSSIIQMRASWT